jgi:hypothetical protein
MDSKSNIDNQLKKSCEIYIENVSEELFGSIRLLVRKVKFNKTRVFFFHQKIIINILV